MPAVTLQDATAYNASDLNGVSIATQNYPAALVWFTPAGGYDGIVNFEISPDNGATWFAAQWVTLDAGVGAGGFDSGFDSGFIDPATTGTTIDEPKTTNAYLIYTPSDSELRVRMSGGSQGTLTVEALRALMKKR